MPHLLKIFEQIFHVCEAWSTCKSQEKSIKEKATLSRYARKTEKRTWWETSKVKTGLTLRLFISCGFKERTSLNESVYQGMKQTGANHISLWIKKANIITTYNNHKNKRTKKKTKKLNGKFGLEFFWGEGERVGRHYFTLKFTQI